MHPFKISCTWNFPTGREGEAKWGACSRLTPCSAFICDLRFAHALISGCLSSWGLSGIFSSCISHCMIHVCHLNVRWYFTPTHFCSIELGPLHSLLQRKQACKLQMPDESSATKLITYLLLISHDPKYLFLVLLENTCCNSISGSTNSHVMPMVRTPC